jgi:group I intron endonuclease
MCKSGIYQIILKSDNRSYIGSAVDIKRRWSNHITASKRTKTKQVIAMAIAKYGADSFKWKVLEHCEIPFLLKREQYWLDTIRPFADENNGFNIRKIADSNFGITRSIESRLKQSKTMSGVPKAEEHKQHMRDVWHNNRGEEYYSQLSERVKGDNNPAKRPEVAKKISKSMTGKTWKDDADRVAKHIAARKGKTFSEEKRANMRRAQQKNNTRSNEAKEKFYLAQRTLYEITTPAGTKFQIYSRELKKFCEENNLQYANLISTAKTKKIYKKGWQAVVV